MATDNTVPLFDWDPALRERYLAACHAMQSGVALSESRGERECTPKHLRVGVNSSMVGHSALAILLIRKGVITSAEYQTAIVEAMEEEKRRYERRYGVEFA